MGYQSLIAFQAEEQGATAIEYALIAALVVLTALIGLTAMSGAMNEMYSSSEGSITSVIDGAGGS